MKKLLLLLALVANGFACNCYAQVVVPTGGGVIINDPDPLDDQGKGNSTQILAIIYQETITVSIDWYAGYADIYVEDEDGNEVADDTIYVNGHASTQLNVSTLPSGTYTLYIKLRDGSIFSGSFQI